MTSPGAGAWGVARRAEECRNPGLLPMIDFEQELPQEDIDRIIESAAQDIVRRGLQTPAILFLETHKPLSFVASQALVVGVPLLGPLFGAERMMQVSKLLRSKENVEKLIGRIESLSVEKSDAAKAEPKDG